MSGKPHAWPRPLTMGLWPTGCAPISVLGPSRAGEVRLQRSGAIMEPRHQRPERVVASRMNLPNSITMTRIVMIPLFLWILSPHFPWQGASGEQEILASILFVLASMTDGFDGYLARKRGQITTMGMLLDPLADKIMVTAALIALVAYNPAGREGLDRGGHHRPRVSHLRAALHRLV